MKRVLCIAALFCVLVSGCTPGPKWDKAEIESRVQARYDKFIKSEGGSATCTEVKLVPDGDNKFTGYANFSDKSQKHVVVTIDPSTGEFIIK